MGDSVLKERVEVLLRRRGELTEGRILDGDGFFIDGHLVVAVIGDDLCVHLGKERWEETLTVDGVRPLMFADRPVPGWVMVDGAAVIGEDALAGWIESGLGGG